MNSSKTTILSIMLLLFLMSCSSGDKPNLQSGAVNEASGKVIGTSDGPDYDPGT